MLLSHPWGSNEGFTRASGNYKEYKRTPSGELVEGVYRSGDVWTLDKFMVNINNIILINNYLNIPKHLYIMLVILNKQSKYINMTCNIQNFDQCLIQVIRK